VGYKAASCCNFTIDECDEWVEFVNVIIDGNEVGEQYGPTLNPDIVATLPAL